MLQGFLSWNAEFERKRVNGTFCFSHGSSLIRRHFKADTYVYGLKEFAMEFEAVHVPRASVHKCLMYQWTTADYREIESLQSWECFRGMEQAPITPAFRPLLIIPLMTVGER